MDINSNTHILHIPFTFNIDETSKMISNSVADNVTKMIAEEVKQIIFGKTWYSNAKYDPNNNEPLREMVKEQIQVLIDENKDDIIKAAGEELVAKMIRSKIFKNAILEAAKTN